SQRARTQRWLHVIRSQTLKKFSSRFMAQPPSSNWMHSAGPAMGHSVQCCRNGSGRAGKTAEAKKIGCAAAHPIFLFLPFSGRRPPARPRLRVHYFFFLAVFFAAFFAGFLAAM